MSWLTGLTGVSTGREGPRFITPAREPPILLDQSSEPVRLRTTDGILDTSAYIDGRLPAIQSADGPILDESPLARNKRGPIHLAELLAGDPGAQTISILSNNVKIRPVEIATYTSLMQLHEDMVKTVRNGHTSVDRNIHIGPEAKQAIEDAIAEYYEKQNLERVKQGLPMLAQRVEND